jgi:phage recombination protein Bet
MNMPATTNKVQSLSTSLAKKLDLGIDGNDLIETLKDTAFKGQVSDSQMSALLIIAGQYGLNPWTKEIYAYPDKQNGIVPVVGVDGWSRIINEHPKLDGIEFNYSPETTNHKGKIAHEWIECVISRSDRQKPIVVREYFDEVCRSVNFVTPWDSHPKRMHRHKTLIQCARIAFGFAGIYDEDEAERIREKDITSQGSHTAARATVSEQLPLYSDSEFQSNLSAWKAAIMEGKANAEFIRSKVSAKAQMTDAQYNQLKDIELDAAALAQEAQK